MLKEEGRIFSVNIQELPQDMIDVLEPLNIKSLLAYPIYIQNRFWGFMGFDECLRNKTWMEDEMTLLSTITSNVTNALERKLYLNQFQNSELRLRLALRGAKEGLWDWNLVTNETYFTDTCYTMVKFVQWGQRQLDMSQLKDLYMMPDGTQATWNRTSWSNPTPKYSNNPYWSRYMDYQNDSRNRIYGNVGISYKILPELKFQYKANLDFFVDKQYERNAVNSQEQSKYKETSRQQYELNHGRAEQNYSAEQ